MKALVVGAGAVGQVYGFCLTRGGGEVTYKVKPKYAEAARAGFTLYELRERSVREPIRFDAFDVVSSVAEVGERTFDLVLLAVSSTALRSGRWLEALAEVIGDAYVVTLQPGLDDHDFVAARVGGDKVISGLIGLAAYAAPLPGEDVPEPGTAFWMPSFVRCPLSGPEAPTTELVALLRRGGMPARVKEDVRRDSAFGTALLQTHVAALEAAGWSVRALRKNKPLLRLARRAMLEAMQVASDVTGYPRPLGPRLAMPWQLGLAMAIAARRAPMDLERFFQAHYTKVGDQSNELFDRWIELAQENELQSENLRALRQQCRHAREPASA